MSISATTEVDGSTVAIRRARFNALQQQDASFAPSLYSVLATACIAPPAHPGLQRVDPDLRMQDYLAALGALAGLDDHRVGALVVLENSGFDPEDLIRKVVESLEPRRPLRSIEVVSFAAPPRPPLMHYGYAEFQMIDLLMDHSTLLTSHFIKITGRYRFPSLSRLLDRISSPPSWICDAQDIPAILGRNASRAANTAIFITSRAFFDRRIRHLYRRMKQLPRFSHVENLIYDELRLEHGCGAGVFLRLPINCEAVGVGGNGEVLATFGRRMKSSFRGVARRLAPRIWL